MGFYLYDSGKWCWNIGVYTKNHIIILRSVQDAWILGDFQQIIIGIQQGILNLFITKVDGIAGVTGMKY